ncbi:helix-turn-helix transcriptional regulator [Halobacillus litoralis]|uniref:helix-turn-helix transcriptional regulator n=1 Tax=Halobacillus litoralis TaxID=45668 RepID=UPI001369CD4C|nr:helix-turn-helix domain-containing protein [Halobacillus litoralis]MYL39130.1 MarR family transcriptional regulator [Halobacillus litoralis]
MNWINIKEHQRFQTKQELDRHVRSYLYQRKPFLSEGTREVLRYVWRHAVKFPGVAFPKRSTIVSAVRCSESTVVRALRTLEKEGLIERVQTKKPNGRQGVNLIVFLPQPDVFFLLMTLLATPFLTPLHLLQLQAALSSAHPKLFRKQRGTKGKLPLVILTPWIIPTCLPSFRSPLLRPHVLFFLRRMF